MSVEHLTILLDRDDLDCVESLYPQAILGVVLVFDVDLHVHLLRRGVPHLTPWDFVDYGEYEKIQAFRQESWRFWSANAHAVFEGVDLLQMLPYRHLRCVGRLAWVAYVIGRALQRLAPKEVVTFEENTGHGLEQPPGYDKMPLLAALARGMAEQVGIATCALSRQSVTGADTFTDWTANSGGHRLEPISPAALLGDRDYVLFPSSGLDLVRQLPLIRRIQDETDFAVVHLYKSADEDALRRMQEVGHLVWHESQVSAHIEPVVRDRFAREGRRMLDSARRGLDGPLRAIFDNPYADIHFDFIFGEYLRKMAWHVRAWSQFLSEHRPSMVVASHPNAIFDIAAHMGIPCLGLSHAPMLLGLTEWFQAFPPCTIGAISEKHRDKLMAVGLPGERIEVTGDPQLDALRQALSETPGPAKSPTGGDLRKRLGVFPDQRLVLLLTASLGSPSKTDGPPRCDWADAVRCFEEIGRLAGRRPQWRFAAKPHPRYDHPSLYEWVNQALPDRCKLLLMGNEPLETVAPQVDAVVACNVVTSALMEASLHGKPVMQLSHSMCWYDRHQWGLDRWPHLETVDELEAELEAIFTDQAVYRERVRWTREALEDYCGGDPQPCASRCLSFIMKNAPTRLAQRC